MKEGHGGKPATKVIYVMGIDGSGKSTVCDFLESYYSDKGLQVTSIWLRFNHLLTKPLLIFCRLIGLTRYETHAGIRVGYHNFGRSKIISKIFFYLQFLDALRVKITKINPCLKKRGNVLILDRYIYDILIDIAMDTKEPDITNTALAKKMIRLLPKGTILIPVVRDKKGLLDARPENAIDKTFEPRLAQYLKIIDEEGLVALNNCGTLEDLQNNALRLTEKNA